MLKFLRQTPVGFWIALLGIAFLVWVFITRLWGFQSGFAFVLIAGYLLVALTTAIQQAGAWITAAVIAGLLALLEIGLTALFWIGSMNEPGLFGVIVSHAVLAIIAIACSLSALTAALRSSPRRSARPAA